MMNLQPLGLADVKMGTIAQHRSSTGSKLKPWLGEKCANKLKDEKLHKT